MELLFRCQFSSIGFTIKTNKTNHFMAYKFLNSGYMRFNSIKLSNFLISFGNSLYARNKITCNVMCNSRLVNAGWIPICFYITESWLSISLMWIKVNIRSLIDYIICRSSHIQTCPVIPNEYTIWQPIISYITHTSHMDKNTKYTLNYNERKCIICNSIEDEYHCSIECSL